MSERVIRVENVSKRYRIGVREKPETFTEQLKNALIYPIRNFRKIANLTSFKEEDESVFWALKDINFEVKQGEVLGIIGHNGAGKSTLLKILSRITEPSSGQIELKGRVSALLEVGTGFHPELTGRDNIYMNGTILGMRKKEIDAKLDEIIAFSGVEKHIDTPVKFYSSGMRVRLAFSVAAHLEPEILVIDEVLAVGDAEFQKKCLGKMEDVAGQGRTVLFVSHNMNAVSRLCTRALLLRNGNVILDGTTKDSISNYLSFKQSNTNIKQLDDSDSEVYLIRAYSTSKVSGEEKGTFDIDESIIVNFEIGLNQHLDDLIPGFTVFNSSGEIIMTSYWSDNPNNIFPNSTKRFTFSIELEQPMLSPDNYFITFGLVSKKNFFRRVYEECISFEILNLSTLEQRKKGILYRPLAWDVTNNYG